VGCLNLANDGVFTIIAPTALLGHAGGTVAQTAQGSGPVQEPTEKQPLPDDRVWE